MFGTLGPVKRFQERQGTSWKSMYYIQIASSDNYSYVSISHLCWCVTIKLCICVSMCERNAIIIYAINYVVHIRCLMDLSDSQAVVL